MLLPNSRTFDARAVSMKAFVASHVLERLFAVRIRRDDATAGLGVKRARTKISAVV